MKPINGIALHTPNFRYPVNNLDDKLNLLCEWKHWVKTDGPLQKDYRATAFDRLHQCLNSRNTYLELSELNLTDLPKNLPIFITSLILVNNKLIRLPESLPDSIQELDISGNQLTVLPTHLPQSLTHLNVAGNRWEHFSVSFPNSLKRIQVRENIKLVIGNHLLEPERSTVIKNAIEYRTSVGFIENLRFWDENIDETAYQWEDIKHEKNAVEFGLYLSKLESETDSVDAELNFKVGLLLSNLVKPHNALKRQQVFLKAKEMFESNSPTRAGINELHELLHYRHA